MNVTLTSEEMANVLVTRLEESAETALPADLRKQLLQFLSQKNGKTATVRPATTPAASTLPPRPLKPHDQRTKVHEPTAKAKKAEHPRTSVEKIVNAIIDSGMCTNDDLERLTKLPQHSVYTAVWRARKDKLISTRAQADLVEKPKR